MSAPLRPEPTILVVEDDEVDRMAIKRAFAEICATAPLHFATDGQAALELMTGAGSCPPLPKPLCVITDLNMPRIDGFELIDIMRTNLRLALVPIFVWTTSDDPDDIRMAYERHVAGYIVKPPDPEKLRAMVRMILGYMQVVSLPA